MRLLWGLILVCLSGPVLAGGSPLRTLVVVNLNSDQSLELGRYYAEKRGIPERQIFSIAVTNKIEIDTAGFSNLIRGPILAYINNSGLSNQIDAIVFSMDIPYRVFLPPYGDQRWAGLTASMFHGFLSSFGVCQVAAGSASAYFQSERAFYHASAPSSNRYYLTAMLTATNLDIARNLVDRTTSVDNQSPTSKVYLLYTEDPFRIIQWVEFDDVMFLGRFLDVPQDRVWIDTNFLTTQTNIMGLTVGRKLHEFLPRSAIVPGAFAESLTSYGGYLFEAKPETVQMSIIEWLRYGFSGSYGTVVEPCANTNKFISPRFHYWYARGFSMGESQWMSVRNPYQGIYVGDPLCAPYANPPTVEWLTITNSTIMSGVVAITGMVTAAGLDQPLMHVGWMRNGVLQPDVTNETPRAGNQLSVSVNGTSRNYTVKSTDTIYSIATNVAASLNQPPSLGITARASGDRVEIKQNSLGVSAAGWTLGAVVSPGTASSVNVTVYIPETNFLETAAAAREGITLSGTALSGDVVRAVVTRLDGAVFTNEVVITTNGAIPRVILSMLVTNIINDVNLQSSIGCYAKYVLDDLDGTVDAWLFARTNTWEGHNLFLDYQVDAVMGSTLSGPDFSDNFNDGSGAQGARATLFVSLGETQHWPVVHLDTTNWPDGPHELTLLARDGSGVETEGRDSVRIQVKNHDLVCDIVQPSNLIYRLKSGVVTVDVTAATSMTVTQIVLFAEGKPVATGQTASLSAVVSLTNYGAGNLNLQAQAWDNGERSVLSLFITIRLYTDQDSDGVSDQWEYQQFGGSTNFNGGADPDGDGYRNVEEFFADTEPTNGLSFLAVQEISSDVGLTFMTSTDRMYRIQINNGDLINAGSWSPTGNYFQGSGELETLLDIAPTNQVRFYAVEPKLP